MTCLNIYWEKIIKYLGILHFNPFKTIMKNCALYNSLLDTRNSQEHLKVEIKSKLTNLEHNRLKVCVRAGRGLPFLRDSALSTSKVSLSPLAIVQNFQSWNPPQETHRFALYSKKISMQKKCGLYDSQRIYRRQWYIVSIMKTDWLHWNLLWT